MDEEDDKAFALAFGKKNAEKRKDWLNSYQEGTCIDYNQKTIRYKDFINKELILFSRYDNIRSIPSVCDGFKPAQRKILYCCFKRNLTSEIKVAQFSGYVSEHSAYHHGEQSLAQAIVGMAQNFVGSNNINLLLPIGQFGSRHMGGKEAASARYIYTAMSKITRHVFRPEDDPLMKYQIEEGQKIEPVWYLPILPMILVNGSEGIGTGWKTTIPNYNPREIVENLKRKLKGEEFKKMVPWFKNFKGEIKKSTNDKKYGYTCYGIIDVKDESSIAVKELPIRRWTRDYKDFLEDMIEGRAKDKEQSKKDSKKDKGRKKKGRDGKSKKRKKDEDNNEKEKKNKKAFNIVVEDLKEHHKGHNIHFDIKVKKETVEELIKPENKHLLIKAFKLTTSLPLTQLICFDHNSNLKRYKDEREIMQEFYELRLKMYGVRKEYMLKRLNRDLAIISNRVRFILAVINEEIIIRKKKKKDIVNKLYELKFTPYSKFESVSELNPQEQTLATENKEEVEEYEGEMKVAGNEYDYLLKMPLLSLTYEKVEELLREKSKKEEEIKALENVTIVQMWENDLDDFLRVLDEVEEEEKEAIKNEEEGKPAKKGKTRRRAAKNPEKKAKKEKKEAESQKPIDNYLKEEDTGKRKKIKESSDTKVIKAESEKQDGTQDSFGNLSDGD